VERAVERMESGTGDRSARDGDFMATQAIQTVLVEFVATARIGTSASNFGDPEIGQNHGRR
jgi:hypothetical protein